MEEEKIKELISEFFIDLDNETIEYFASLLSDSNITSSLLQLQESFQPFIESYNIDNADIICEKIYMKLCSNSNNNGNGKNNSNSSIDNDAPVLLDKTIQLSETLISSEEQASLDTLWGFDKIRERRNDVFEATEAASAKYERKALKEQKKWLEELESQFVGEEGNDNLSTMTIPDFTGNNREKDIHVHNFNMNYCGKILLECADLRLVYGRRYGIVGVNGVGKSTLLKHIANFEIEGFPRHHRVLHVKQEVQSSDATVLNLVLNADVERTELLKREKLLLDQQQNMTDMKELERISEELKEVYERMEIIQTTNAEARAATILRGLQFSEEMQSRPISSFSGGWKMRIALAAALFIEPDLLMLDECTNHLDLEGVLWLQNYLLSYKHTILIVSHDRTFLNEVATDVIQFKDLKLNYFKGNYDVYEITYDNMSNLKAKQHDAQMAKIEHMQEFVDKFRYNAKRASLVQSRIKAIQKETLVLEEVEEEEKAFSFFFPDCGSLGQPVIKIDNVSFSYPNQEPLFRSVDLAIDQTSRIALVGPNGAGKSTLLNLLQGKLKATDGIVVVNPQLRIGIFTQYHMDSWDLKLSPLQNMMNRWPLAPEAELRSHLGRYEINGNDALKPMKFSSGGILFSLLFYCYYYYYYYYYSRSKK